MRLPKLKNGSRTIQLLNVGLHGANLFSRFLFIFFLAKLLPTDQVGFYGLFAATVSYSMYFVGLDFYTYATRAIVKTPLSERGGLIKAHLTLSGILYLAFVPIVYVILIPHSGWPLSLLLAFIPVLILDHFNQEGYRLLAVLSKQLSASASLFIRQGLLSLTAVILMLTMPTARNLNTIFFLWILLGLVAASFTVWRFRGLNFGGWHLPIDWNWIKKGVVISATFLVGTFALRGFQTFDRYWLSEIGGVEIVAAYVLFFGVASALMAFLDSGVFAFLLPKLIVAHHEKNLAKARTILKKMILSTIFVSFIYSIASSFLLPYFLEFVGNDFYAENIKFYPWLLSATVINAMGMVPHFGLYAAGADKTIVMANVIALIVFVVSAVVLAKYYKVLSVPIAMNFAFTALFLANSIAYRKILCSEPDFNKL